MIRILVIFAAQLAISWLVAGVVIHLVNTLTLTDWQAVAEAVRHARQ